jgi:hypothetical protein
MNEPFCKECHQSADFVFNSKSRSYHITCMDCMNNIGQGELGTVIKALDCNHSKYALIKFDQSNEQIDLTDLQKEAERMQSRNVLYVIESFYQQQHLFISLPLFDTRNFDIITTDIRSEADALSYFTKICYAVKELSYYKYLTKSFNFSNILLPIVTTSSTYIALGCWNKVRKAFGKNNSINGLELQNVKRNYNTNDTFMLGVLLYGLISGRDFFDCYNASPFGRNIIGIKPKEIFKSKCLSRVTMSILEGCLQLDKDKRIALEDIFELMKIDINHNKGLQSLYESYQCDRDCIINLQSYERAIKSSYSLISHVNSIDLGVTLKQANTTVMSKNKNENKASSNSNKWCAQKQMYSKQSVREYPRTSEKKSSGMGVFSAVAITTLIGLAKMVAWLI